MGLSTKDEIDLSYVAVANLLISPFVMPPMYTSNSWMNNNPSRENFDIDDIRYQASERII